MPKDKLIFLQKWEDDYSIYVMWGDKETSGAATAYCEVITKKQRVDNRPVEVV